MNGKKILLIEDDLFIRDLYTQILENQGYNVVSANDGVAGLQLVRDNLDADLIILDIMLPKMHGVDVLRNIKADQLTQNIPVVILSNLTEQKVIAESLRLGALGYLIKVQVSPEQLIVKVNSYVNFLA